MERTKYAIVDLETTGHSHHTGDRIIQIAIVIMQDWEVVTRYTKFIHPGMSIPTFIQGLTNISDDDVKDAQSFEFYADKIYELLADCVFVAHNADFDLNFLQAEFNRVGLPKWHGKKMDTVELAKILFPTAISYKLSDLAAELQIELPNAHRADDDAYATAMLFRKCWEKLMQLPLTTLETMHKRSFRLRSNLAQLFFDAIYEKRRHVEPLTNHFFYKKLALKKESLTTDSETAPPYPLTIEEKQNLFKQAFPHFEERPAQFQMMDLVWNGLANQKETVIEASTGIGKTMAYLIPAYIYAKQHDKKIVISTYTSTLMDQLLYEEIQKLEKVIGEKANVALLKGMTNYIDVERFSQFVNTHDDSYDETFATLQIIVWLTETATGDLNELNISGGGQLFIEKVRKSPYNESNIREIDFYARAIQHAAQATLIVTNHANVLADLSRATSVFPEIAGWIFDEAHQFVHAAASKNEVIFNYVSWKYLMGQVGTMHEETLYNKIYKLALKKQLVSSTQLRKCDQQFVELMKVFDQSIHHIVQPLEDELQKMNAQQLKCTVFLKDLQLPFPKFQYLSFVLQAWIRHAEEITQSFEQSVDELPLEHQALLNDWKFAIQEWKLKIVEWDEVFLNLQQTDSIWLEVDRRSIPGSIRIVKKPLHLQSLIHQTIDPIRKNGAIIWTSGTLTVPMDDHFITDQLAIHRDITVHKLHAPEHYYAGAKSYVVTDMPDVQRVTQTEYVTAISDAIIRIAQAVQGRCFVLFTAQDMLKHTAELVHERNELQDFVLFAQGVSSGSRTKLLKSFQKYKKSILFGTNSFWEGVDVPEDGLAAVIIVRLPFSSPDEPIFKAKSQQLQQQGENSFTKLALPEAILRLKQGFGRLIRSSNDKGSFIILDRRIETKSYGEQFIQSIPTKTIEKVTLQHMVQQLEHWYNE